MSEFYNDTTSFGNNLIYGDWRIKNQKEETLFIRLLNLKPFLTEDRIKTVNFDDIAYKSFDLDRSKTHENCLCCGGTRFFDCDVDYLGILLEGKEYNKFGKKYRMLDGKHRMMKLKDMSKTEYDFYVLSYDEVKEYMIKEELL